MVYNALIMFGAQITRLWGTNHTYPHCAIDLVRQPELSLHRLDHTQHAEVQKALSCAQLRVAAFPGRLVEKIIPTVRVWHFIQFFRSFREFA